MQRKIGIALWKTLGKRGGKGVEKRPSLWKSTVHNRPVSSPLRISTVFHRYEQVIHMVFHNGKPRPVRQMGLFPQTTVPPATPTGPCI